MFMVMLLLAWRIRDCTVFTPSSFSARSVENVLEHVPTNVLGYQVAHFSFLMTIKTSFHNRFVCCLSLQLDHFMPDTSTQLGLRKVRVAFNAKPLYFLARRCVMNKRRNPFRSWQLRGARTKNMDKSG